MDALYLVLADAKVGNWVQTGGVGLVLGVLTFIATRRGQRDQARSAEVAAKIQEAQEHRLEIQQALDAQKSISEQWRQTAVDRGAEAADLRTQLRAADEEKRALLDLVMRQVNDSAEKTEQAMPDDSMDGPPTTS